MIPPIYIGIAGQKQNGKDTVADYMQAQLLKDDEFVFQFERAAFAANVKRVFVETFDVTYEFIEKWKTIPEPPPGFDMPVREALQFIGDGFRKIKASIWIDLMFRQALNKIISDVRYINEADRIVQENGFNLLVAHPERLNDDPNGSEAQIRPYAAWCLQNMLTSGDPNTIDAPDKPESMHLFSYFILNNGTVADVYSVVDTQIIPMIKTKIGEMSNDAAI